MGGLTSLVLVVLQICGCLVTESLGAMIPVYGFMGASSATTSGRSLHYTVHLNKCRQVSGPANPEFSETFGGHVTTWRTVNDREASEIPYLTFYNQKPVYNNTGHLAQLSRGILIWSNDTVVVTTIIYSADLSSETYMYEHECRMSSQTVKGEIDMVASTDLPMPLNSFAEIVSAMETGTMVHFTAMVFLCPGGVEHTFSSFGGHIPNYDLVYDDDALVEIKSAIEQIAHYEEKLSVSILDVINMRIFNNNTVDIYNDIGVPPEMNRVASKKAQCILSTGMPGGMVHVWGRGTPPGNCY